jgi:GAF domain-containing protein
MLDADDPDHTLSMVLEGIGRVGRFDLVLLALLDPGENALVVRLAYGERVEEGLRVLVVPCGAGSGLLAETLLGRAPRLVAEGTAALLVPAGAPAPPLPAGAYVTHPLVTRGRGAGVVLAARTRGPVGPDDLPMLDLFCNQATLALERAGR